MSGPYAVGPVSQSPTGQPPQQGASSGGLGTASLVLGIIAVVLAFVPVLLHIGFVVGVLALVFGIVALRRQNRRGLVGVILGSISVVIALVFGTVYGVAFFSSLGISSQESEAAPAATEAAGVAQVQVPDVVGETVADASAALEAAGFDVDTNGADAAATVADQSPAATTSVDPGSTVRLTAAEADGSSASSPAPAGTKFEMTNTNRIDGSSADYTQWLDGYNDNFTSSNEFEQADANMKYVLLTVHVEANTSGVDASSAAYDVALAGPDGTVYESEYLSDVKSMPSVTLGEGQSATGQVVFQVPNSFHGGVASFGDGSVFVKTN